jgi:DNA-binding NarL/FixJ family response regulator
MSGKPSVFLCDDSASFRMLLRLQLEERGYRVIGETGDPAAVADALREAQPDVALVDGFLPDTMPLSELRRGAPLMKIVLYSGMPQARLDEVAADTRPDAALSKSAGFDELVALIDQLSAGSGFGR